MISGTGIDGRDDLFKYLGRMGLHPFYPGFRDNGIDSSKKLKAMGSAEIRTTCGKFNMPPPAVDRLLETLGKKNEKVKPLQPKPTTQLAKKAKPAPAEKPKAKILSSSSVVPGNTAKSDDSKMKSDSTYYHGRPKQTNEFSGVKVANDKSASFGDGAGKKGRSAWNPGNTFEDKDYSTWTRNRLREVIEAFTVEAFGVKFSNVKTTGDANIILNRGRIKYIYDLQFKADWKASVDGQEVEGKIEAEDIACDEEADDWQIDVTTKKNTPAHRNAVAAIKSARSVLVEQIQVVIAEFRSKGG